RLPGAKPRTNARVGQPFFRTLREYGGRAIVSDAWDKGHHYDGLDRDITTLILPADAIETSRVIAGNGIAAHRSAYGVLYTDGHVQSFGDPQERFIWHTQGAQDYNNTAVVTTMYYTGTLFYNLHLVSRSSGGGGLNRGCFNDPWRGVNSVFAHTPYALWHELDNAAGIDVGVDDP
ncbi:MAG TPA: hypothetical protein P5137_11070, partial [Candidatus Brocadiia bacterium]|nr:hypothetical protein [Candidatus Brocadiia bacterium]